MELSQQFPIQSFNFPFSSLCRVSEFGKFFIHADAWEILDAAWWSILQKKKRWIYLLRFLLWEDGHYNNAHFFQRTSLQNTPDWLKVHHAMMIEIDYVIIITSDKLEKDISFFLSFLNMEIPLVHQLLHPRIKEVHMYVSFNVLHMYTIYTILYIKWSVQLWFDVTNIRLFCSTAKFIIWCFLIFVHGSSASSAILLWRQKYLT